MLNTITSRFSLSGMGERHLRKLAGALHSAADTAAAIPAPAWPLPEGSPELVGKQVSGTLGPGFPRTGSGATEALALMTNVLTEHGLDLTHPHTAAHLQPPVLDVAVAADALASIGNGSQDTYDSGPAGIAIERWVISALAGMAGFNEDADGVFTPGGSISNLMAVMFARDAAGRRRGIDVRFEGVAALGNPIVFCSEVAHFSITRAAAALGLGESAVRAIAVDERRRMRPEALRAALERLAPNDVPLCVVATAGTTDFGTVDPLADVAAIARDFGVWLHVDAAAGFGSLFSEALAPRLAGIELADSVTLDLHKIGWLPAATSAVLVRDKSVFASVSLNAHCLNPADDGEAGFDGLLGHSLQVTRRPDAIKVAATLLAHGTDELGKMVNACHSLARHAEQLLRDDPAFELVAPAELITVVFRHRATPDRVDLLNAEIRRALLTSGLAVVGRTTVDGVGICLKLTLLNPNATEDDITELIALIRHTARAIETRTQDHSDPLLHRSGEKAPSRWKHAPHRSS